MRRRDFITLLGGASVAWPLAARAQQSTVHRIAIVHPSAPVADIADLIGSVNGLPADLSARKKRYLRATGYGRKRPR